jgi:hypothetical protein
MRPAIACIARRVPFVAAMKNALDTFAQERIVRGLRHVATKSSRRYSMHSAFDIVNLPALRPQACSEGTCMPANRKDFAPTID